MSATLFPPLCPHCESETNQLFCTSCAQFFQLIDPKQRCPFCFQEKEQGSALCSDCFKEPFMHGHCAAALEYLGPVQDLIKLFKYNSEWHLAKTGAAFLIAQFARLNWPMPDAVIPVPQSRLKTFFRGYNHSSLLAKEFAKKLELNFVEALSRRGGDYGQAHLSFKERRNIPSDSIKLKKCSIKDKTLLLIDDVMTTGATLKQCAEVLYEGFAGQVYALSLCC